MVPGISHLRRKRSAEFRFYAELNDYLPEARRKTRFRHEFHGTPSVLDTVQAIGVPHPEVDLVLVDGRSVGFSHRLHGGEQVSVYPVFERLDISPVVRLRPEPLRDTRFVLDGHLGKLARLLRMLGFDASWRADRDDEAIIDRSLQQGRIILTRDVGLLKHGRVTHGYWLRSQQPARQLEEVVLALDLAGQINPFSRCMDCNGEIGSAAVEDLEGTLDPNIIARFDRFWRCHDCGKIYWCGSHHERMLQTVRLVECRALIEKLLDPAAYPHETGHIQLIETHISWVILTGDYAYKLKKPVKLGFLDFSTPERRRQFCEEELRVNRRTAPQLYLDIVPIGASKEGIRVGAEPAVEHAVRMRQFPHAARLDRCLQSGRLGLRDMRKLAATIARFHAGLPSCRATEAADMAERAARPARKNFVHLDPDRLADGLLQKLAVIESWTLQQADALQQVFRSRAANGSVRECHGDLHLENLLYLEDRFVLFDAIEFNPDLRWIDMANDIAFLAMDLMARGRSELAFTLLNSWLEISGDYDSLAVMRFYLVYRSMVRAVVTSIRQQQQSRRSGESFRLESDRYISLAAELVDTPLPRLLLMHGFSGSGKTWTSEKLVARLPALRLRSDLERKRLPDPAPAQSSVGRIGVGLYGREVTDRTYETLARHCEAGLQAGFSMIADATFLYRRHRDLFRAMAERNGVRLQIVDCRADEDTLRARIRNRSVGGADASDADLDVLDFQLQQHEPLDESEQKLVSDPLSDAGETGHGSPSG